MKGDHRSLRPALYRWDVHCAYSYSSNLNEINPQIDLDSGILAKTCRNLDNTFTNLTNFYSFFGSRNKNFFQMVQNQ